MRILLIQVFIWTALSAFAAPKAPEYAEDLGPERIDVSGYPVPQQEAYKKFEAKCSVCHSAARAINSPFVTSEEWSRYIKRMWLRPPCCNICPAISKEEARVIWKFLTYDSQVRKTGAHAAEWRTHRLALLEQFKRQYPKKYSERYGTSAQKERNSL